jgi:hydroxypyruvate isomerase
MFRLSVCADTLFLDLPFVQRMHEIAQAGFLVEFWGWQGRDLEAIVADPTIQISAFTGDSGGSLVHPDGLELFLAGVKKTLVIAKKLQCRELVLHSGEINHAGQIVHSIAAHPATMWITAYKGLCQVAELAERHDIIYNLEHLNTRVDHAGYPLPRVADVARLIAEVGSPRLKLLLDIYHAQIEEGNLIETIRTYADHIGYIHVADVPGRHEPGTGEINYPSIAEALREVGYAGVIGLEAFPQSDSELAMARFREAFS